MVPCRVGRHLVDRASQLPPELWGRIFCHIQSDIRGLFGTYPPNGIWEEEQKPYRQLQLVCKRFRDLFAAVPFLSEAVALPNAPHTLLPSLLAWLRSQSSSVRILAAEGSYLDVALASLGIPSPPLQNLIAWRASPKAMAILPIFMSLQSCDLSSPNTDANAPLDLSPLQALPRLQQLHLSTGSFCNLHAAAHLTSLWISSSSIVGSQQDCRFAGTLRNLNVFDSDIQGFHSSGVCACMALECLNIRDSVIGATQGNETLQLQDNNQFHIPDGITSLTSLAAVTVHPQKSAVQQSYDWLFVLTSLTALCFHLSPKASLTVPDGLSRLQRLQRFAVTAPRQEELDFPTLTLQVDWDLMLLLKQVKFIRQIIICDRKIMQLPLVKSLVVLKLTHSVLRGKLSLQDMTRLGNSIALLNPHMTFVVDKCDASAALAAAEMMQFGAGS